MEQLNSNLTCLFTQAFKINTNKVDDRNFSKKKSICSALQVLQYSRRKEMCCGGDWRGSGSTLHPVHSPREADLLVGLAFGPYYFG